jgi:hypothetical protein
MLSEIAAPAEKPDVDAGKSDSSEASTLHERPPNHDGAF